ncbi:MAG: hypothetical protein PUD07_05435 [bacterium]|nr:hypothetical protein [bacterium]
MPSKAGKCHQKLKYEEPCGSDKKYGIEIQVIEMDVVPGRDKNGKQFGYDSQNISKNATIWNTVFKYANKYGVRAITGWGISDALCWSLILIVQW